MQYVFIIGVVRSTFLSCMKLCFWTAFAFGNYKIQSKIVLQKIFSSQSTSAKLVKTFLPFLEVVLNNFLKTLCIYLKNGGEYKTFDCVNQFC